MSRVYTLDAGYACKAVCTVTGHAGGDPAEAPEANVRILGCLAAWGGWLFFVDAEGMDVTTFFTAEFAEYFAEKALELDAKALP